MKGWREGEGGGGRDGGRGREGGRDIEGGREGKVGGKECQPNRIYMHPDDVGLVV